MIEKALIIDNINDFNNKYDVIYFGFEFCDKRIPNIKDIKLIEKKCLVNKMKFVFVTPIFSINNSKKIKNILKKLSNKSEIVINDFGVLDIIRDLKLKNKLILGRLLTKQKKFYHKLENIKLIEYFKQSTLSNKLFINFLKKYNIYRIEFDNSIYLPKLLKSYNFKYSLYAPFCLLTTSTNCLFIKNLKIKNDNCNNICKFGYFIEYSNNNEKIFNFGKSQFYHISSKEYLKHNEYDRIVYNNNLFNVKNE